MFALQFYDMYSTDVEVEGHGELSLVSETVNASPLYFIRGELLHISELDDDRVVQNLELHDYTHCLKYGAFITPYEQNYEYIADEYRRNQHGSDGRDSQPDGSV